MEIFLYIISFIMVVCSLYVAWFLIFKLAPETIKGIQDKFEDEALLKKYHEDIESCDLFKFRKITKDFIDSHPLKLTPAQVYEKIRLDKY